MSRLGTASSLALLATIGSAAHAQQSTAVGGANAQPPSSLEEITVTGSRIRRTTDFTTANPTTVVDNAFLTNLGLVNVGEAVAQLPSNVSNNTPTTTGNANFFAGSTIANLRGLNPFFGSRTLTLVDNHRFVPTNQGDGVDLNFIPSVLIDRIDVVTGGASAAYGSGAISGVQNIFLDRKLDGVRLDFDGYETGHGGDGDDTHVGVAWGHGFSDGARLVLGFEHQKTDVVDCLDRDWCRNGVGFIAGGAGQPSNVLVSNARMNQVSSTGVFNNFAPGAAIAQQANAAGTALAPFNIGQGASTVPFNSVVGGDGASIYQYTNLRAPLDRNLATGLFSIPLTDTLNMTVDVSYGKVKTDNVTGALNDNLDALHPDNAFLSLNPGLAAAVDPVLGASLNKDWTSQLDSHSTFTTDVKRAVVSFDGELSKSWSWDAYYQYGETERDQFVADNRHLNAYLMAVDSVLDANGNPICRVTRDGFAAAAAATPAYALADPQIAQGCVPLNPFGSQAIPTDARAYAFGFLDEDLTYKQNVGAFDVSGDIWQGMGAGPFQLAAGAEYRDEIGHNVGSQNGAPDYVRTDYLIQYGESFSGKVGVTEAFVELNTPLVKDKPGVKRLEFNSALRESRYRNEGLEGTTGETRSHSFTTWKVSGIYDPLDWLRVRTTRSRDMRAANFRELYYGQKIHAGGSFGFCGPAGSFQVDPCDWSLEGNVDLKPERADTTTFGLVFTPIEKLSGLDFAADYFKIKIADAIQQASVRQVLDGCQISNLAEFCSQLVPDSPGDFSSIRSLRALSFNGSGYTYAGVDLTGDYKIELDHGAAVNIRLLATRMFEQEFQPTPGQPFVDIVGQTGTSNSFLSDNQPTAKWMSNLSSTYTRGPVSVTGQWRYVASGEMNYYGITPEDPGYVTATAPLVTMSTNSVPSYGVYALSGSYAFKAGGMQTQLFATIDNLFDKDPPIAAGSGFGGNTNGGTDAVFFDTLGRAFRVGVRMNF